MKRFLKQALAATLGFFIALVVLVALSLSIVNWFSGQPKPAKLSGPAVLCIELAGQLVEYNPKAASPAWIAESNQPIDLVALKAAIKDAQTDPHIKGIYLSVGQLAAGWASLAEIREALQAFKATGKFIVAYGEHYTQKTFYVASLADEVVVHPFSLFCFNGLSMKILFYEGLLSKLEVKPQVFVAGHYKSALEPLVRKAMSEANKHQHEVLRDALYDHLIDNVAAARGLLSESLRKMAHDLAIKTPQEALAARLITEVGYADDAEAWIRTKLGLAKGDDVDYISLSRYTQIRQAQAPKSSKAQVAVLVASGSITDDPEASDGINTQEFVENLQRLSEDPTVKAIVLRINSPGGSVLASATMWKELMRTRACKPIVASLSDVAASGGYYLALACNYIIAHPTTITGSVGVFGLYFTIDSLLSKLGITVDGVKTAPSADFFSMTRPPSAHEKAAIQHLIDQSYKNFVELVATSRQLSPEEAERVSGGRIWTGSLAKDNGLVDELGSLEDAIKKAASLASLEEGYTVSYYPEAGTWLEGVLKILKGRQGAILVNHAHRQLDPYLQIILKLCAMRGIQARYQLDPYLQIILKLCAMRGIQARLPYDIEID